jgi:primosomal protein N'
MRNLAFRLLAVGLVVAVASPVMAQRPQRGGGGRGGFGQMDPALVIFQTPVQEELKLNDAQKADATKARDKMRTSMGEAFQSANGDREKMQEAMKTVSEAAKKDAEKIKESLTPDQAKRLKQLQIQFAGMRAFADADVQNELKLNDKQKTDIKEIADGVAKDSQELRAGAQGDRAKMQEVGRKIEALNKEAMDKIAGVLTDDQKKSWTAMVGEKFDKFERMGGGQGGGRRPRQGGNNNNQQN